MNLSISYYQKDIIEPCPSSFSNDIDLLLNNFFEIGRPTEWNLRQGSSIKFEQGASTLDLRVLYITIKGETMTNLE